VPHDLYLERWLLTVKIAAAAAGLTAHVRALDAKGGRLLALEMSQENEALELRYRKRLRGPRMVAAATSTAIVKPASEVFEKLLAEHRRLLENGFRRFLRQSRELLLQLEAAFARDAAGLRARVVSVLGKGSEGARPAVAVQPGKRGQGEAFPAVARPLGYSYIFSVWENGRFIDLSWLFPGDKDSSTMAVGTAGGLPPLPVVAASMKSVELSFPTIPPTSPAGGSPASAPAGAALTPGAGSTSGGGGMGANLTADFVGNVVEVVANAGSCLGDASCSGIDLGGLDCNLG
jgi:hypothetical protein